MDVYKKVINCIENNYLVKSLILCEPQLGKRGLYPKFTTKDNMDDTTNMKNLISYADGRSALEISELIRVPFWKLQRLLSKLIKENILSIKSEDYNN